MHRSQWQVTKEVQRDPRENGISHPIGGQGEYYEVFFYIIYIVLPID
jgi:hypothetical protein